MKILQRSLALFLSNLLLFAAAPGGGVYAQPADKPTTPSTTAAAQQTPEELQQLVAPIALYPDALVSQILAGATYPGEIVEADRWMQAHPNLQGKDLGKEVNKESWDPSVKALTQFPSVLADMDKNLSWTSSLGEAYVNQPNDVMNAVQVMRVRAKNAGNLKTGQQEKVKTEGQNIIIEPVDADVVYVPTYDPWLVFGAPVAMWPGWYAYPGLYIAGPGISFGLGFGIGFFAGFGWGWHHWGCDWAHRTVIYNHRTYISHSTTFASRNNFHRTTNNFHRTSNNFHHNTNSSSHAQRVAQHGSLSRSGSHSAFSGFSHGGFARGFSARGRSSFGGGFHGGGFHGGGGRR